MPCRLACLIGLCCLPSSLRADDPVFVARLASGKEVRGPLVALTEEGALEIGKGVRRRIAAGDLLSLTRAGRRLPEYPTDEHVILANGDRVPVREPRLDDEKLRFRHKDLAADAEVAIPLSSVALIWRLAPDGTVSPEKLRRRLLRSKRTRDVILLRNGDTLEGTLEGLAAGQVTVEVNKKSVTARWTQVAAIAMSTELTDRLRPKGLHARLVFAPGNGSPGGRLTLTSFRSDDTTLTGKTVFGAALGVPLDRVVALDLASPGIVALGDLEPAKYEHVPFLDERWPYSIDATVTGRDLRLGGSTHDRGISMHASSTLTYALDGSHRRFEALVGLDDQDGRKGRVRPRLRVDGKEVELSKKAYWTHADGALTVSVEIKGAKQLTLEVLPADRGPIQAVVNWVNPRLLK